MKCTNYCFKPLGLLFLLCLIPLWAFSQNITVKGVVKDATGESVIGASVVQKGTSNGIITDIDGNFTLNVPSNSTIVISFVGYKTQEIPVAGKTQINVTMKEDTEMLDEVVVVGYGQMKRSDNALRLSMLFTLAFAFSIMLLFICFTRSIVTLFIPDTASAAWGYAVAGLPLFATDYLFFGINIIIIGYYTSIERLRRAISLTVLRGILPVVFFFTLPLLLDVNGIWLAVAAGDITTTVVIVILLIVDKVRKNG